MTAFVGPSEPGIPTPLLPRPVRPPVAGPGRGIVLCTAGVVAAALGAVVLAGVSFAKPSTGPIGTVVVPWTPPTPSVAQLTAARTRACEVWNTTALAIDGATNAVSTLPGDWNDPVTQEALANEARVMLVEGAYLRHELPADTPSPIRTGINDYLGAGVDMENATAHRQGTARNAAIDRANAAEAKVNTACR